MSKQTKAKQIQNYIDRAEKRQCSVCRHYRSTIIERPASGYMLQVWTDEKNIHCGLGGFKIKKTAICDMFERKDEDVPSNPP